MAVPVAVGPQRDGKTLMDGKTLLDAIEKAGRTLEGSKVQRVSATKFAPGTVKEEELSSAITIEVPFREGILRNEKVYFSTFLETARLYKEIEIGIELKRDWNWKGYLTGSIVSLTVVGLIFWPIGDFLSYPDFLSTTSKRFPEVKPLFRQLVNEIYREAKISA